MMRHIRLLISLSALTLSVYACDDEVSPPEVGGAPVEAGLEAGAMRAGTPGGAEGGVIGGDAGGDMGGEAPVSCVPDEEGRREAEAFLQESCGLCHGEPPQFGAPYPLTDLSALLTEEGSGQLERAVARLVEGTMPPTGQPQPTPEAAQAFIDWATCGRGPQRLTPPGGFEVSRPRYPSPGAPPSDASEKELLATAVELDPDEVDQYKCFLYSGPGEVGEERGVVRFEPVIDDARVVHHIVLYEASETIAFEGDGAPVDCGAGLGAAIYAWAPGQEALHFTEGALVSGGDKRYLLELHYNNSAQLDGLVDSSGVRLYHTPPQEPRIDMMTFGPDGFQLPAMSRTEVEGYCELQEELGVIALMPHMHELGVNISSEIKRAGDPSGLWEDLISLTGWDFNFQLTYDAQGTTLYPGDLVKTTCLFENNSSRDRRFGPFTEDEMCYQFAYVTPPPAERRCDHDLEGASYTPGGCAPTDAESIATPIVGSYKIGEPPSPTGGELPIGTLPMTSVEIWFAQENLGPLTIDPEASRYDGSGVVSLNEEGLFALDVQGVSNAVSAQGASFMLPMEISFGGQLSPSMEEDTLTLNISCPEESGARQVVYSAGPGHFTFHQGFDQPVEGTLLITFGTP